MKNAVLMLVLLSGCRFHAADEESFRTVGSGSYDRVYDSNPLPVRCLVTASTEQATGTVVAVEDGGTIEVQITGETQIIRAHLDGAEDTDLNYSRLTSRIGLRVQMDVIYRISSTSWVVEIPALY